MKGRSFPIPLDASFKGRPTAQPTGAQARAPELSYRVIALAAACALLVVYLLT